jgi:molecular chaperone GrpE
MKKKHEAHPAESLNAAPAPGDAAASAAPPAARAEDEVTRLRAREDDLLRALAELQNVNRRRKQEAEAAARFAAEPLVRELLAVLDDFERALRAISAPDDPLRAGVALVHDRLVKILEKEGLEPIRPLGDAFDPELHDAIAHLPIPGAAPGTVVEVAVPGYRFRDRVLRHAKVVVAADPEGGGGEADEALGAEGSAEPRGGV